MSGFLPLKGRSFFRRCVDLCWIQVVLGSSVMIATIVPCAGNRICALELLFSCLFILYVFIKTRLLANAKAEIPESLSI